MTSNKRYTKEYKEKILNSLMPPQSKTVSQIVKEEGINRNTVYSWGRKARNEGASIPNSSPSHQKKWLLLFPTKKHWRSPSKIEYIEAGLKKFVKYYDKFGIESIAFPKLGCGNGGLDWEIVKPIMEEYLKQLPIHVYIYVDKYEESKPEHKQPTEIEKWLRDDIEAIGFSLIKEDLKKSIQNDNELLINNSELKHISWNENNIHLINGEEIIINEKELCDLWSYIRDVGVIETKDIPNRFEKYGEIILDIFKKLDYLQPITISDDGKIFANSSNGYQYIRR
jgi:transposase-like protein